jgi:hypothetical protein
MKWMRPVGGDDDDETATIFWLYDRIHWRFLKLIGRWKRTRGTVFANLNVVGPLNPFQFIELENLLEQCYERDWEQISGCDDCS